MKRSILILALALAFSFTATPADAALSNADKCNVFRAKTEMNFAKCMKIANLLEAKGKTADRAKCVTKYDDGIAKAKTKFVNDKLGVTEADCSLDQSSTDGAKALDIVSAGQELANFDLNTGTLPMLDDIQSLVDEAVASASHTNCSIAVMCRHFSEISYYLSDTLIEELDHEKPTNRYADATAESTGCDADRWANWRTFLANRITTFRPSSLYFGDADSGGFLATAGNSLCE